MWNQVNIKNLRSNTAQHVPKYGIFLTFMFAYKDKIFNSLLIREYTYQRKLVFWHILRSRIKSATLPTKMLLSELKSIV